MSAQGDCDICGEWKPRLLRVIAYGTETYACPECCGDIEENDREQIKLAKSVDPFPTI